MTERRQRTRVPGLVRVLGLLVLVLGIGVMHAGICAEGSDAHAQHAALPSAATGLLSAHHDVAAAAGGHDADTHYMDHPCVFVLSIVALIIGLVLLYRGGFRPGAPTGPMYARWRAQRGRPPPWTAPTLNELSILRI